VTAQITSFDGRPLLHLTRRVTLENGHKRYACLVCGLVYAMRSCANVCCGEKKHKAGVAYWWPARKIYKPFLKPVGRLNGDGELTLYDKV